MRLSPPFLPDETGLCLQILEFFSALLRKPAVLMHLPATNQKAESGEKQSYLPWDQTFARAEAVTWPSSTLCGRNARCIAKQERATESEILLMQIRGRI